MERENDNRTSAQRYVDILTEAGFKAVFGVEKNKDVLIGLLNVVLPAHRRVTDLAYSTTEVPGFTMSNKSVRLDLRCTGEDGTRFIVEMQCYRQLNFFRRCVEYAAKVYDSGSERGDAHGYDIPPVYFVGLLNTGVPKFDRSDSAVWRDRYVSEYTFREKESHEVVDETIFLIFAEHDFSYLCRTGPLRQEAGGVREHGGQVVLFAEACREDGEAAGGVEGEGVREAVRGVRDSEVHPGRETEIRTRYDDRT